MTTQLIPVVSAVIGSQTVQTVDGRALHTFLEVQTEFSKWMDRRIEEYGFIEEQDFSSFLAKTPQGGRPSKEYALTLNMAKELSMVERTPKGKQARQYFIECERRALAAALAQPQPPLLPPARKPIRSRDDLAFVKRDADGRLNNWAVLHFSTDHVGGGCWDLSFREGEFYFAQLMELAQHNVNEARDALQYALVGGAASNWPKGGFGQECGFATALALALFPPAAAPVKKLPGRQPQGRAA